MSASAEFFARFTLLDAALWLAGGSTLLAILTPILATAMGIQFIRNHVDNNPVLAKPDGTDPEYAERFAELQALGFRAAGVVYEQVYLNQDEWYVCIPVSVMASKDGATFAMLYRLHSGGGVLRMAFDTIVSDQRLVRTVMPGAGLGGFEGEYLRVEVPLQPAAEVYRQHQSTIAEFLAHHRGVVQAVTLIERTAVEVRFETRQLREIGNGGVWLYPVIGWLVPFVLALAFLSWGPKVAAPGVYGWAAVAAALAYWVFTRRIMPWLHNFCERCEANPDEETAETHSRDHV